MMWNGCSPMSSRILLVEDDPVNLYAISSILKAEGYHISVAPSGQKALEIEEIRHAEKA